MAQVTVSASLPQSFTNLDLGSGFPRARRKHKDLSEDFGPEPEPSLWALGWISVLIQFHPV